MENEPNFWYQIIGIGLFVGIIIQLAIPEYARMILERAFTLSVLLGVVFSLIEALVSPEPMSYGAGLALAGLTAYLGGQIIAFFQRK